MEYFQHNQIGPPPIFGPPPEPRCARLQGSSRIDDIRYLRRKGHSDLILFVLGEQNVSSSHINKQRVYFPS